MSGSMSCVSKGTIPVWREKEAPKPDFPLLDENQRADVCIVGAGIAGLTTAYLLAKEGKSVIVIDARGISTGETSRTTAHLTAVLDDRFFRLEQLFGVENAHLAADSHRAAIDRIETIVRDEHIDCDFSRLDGFLVVCGENQNKEFEKERDALRRAGFSDMEVLPDVQIPEIQGMGPAARFPRQGAFHIQNYMTGLANAVQRYGGRICTGQVVEVKGGADARVTTDVGKTIHANAIVVATNAPINDWAAIYTKQAAYRTYVIAYEIAKGSYPDFLLWDMEDPYHYVRVVHGIELDMLVVGGEDHKVGQANDAEQRWQRLDDWAQEYFGQLGPIDYRWSGQVMEPVDSLAFIGRNPMDAENVFIATGDSGNGMTHGTIAGILNSDLIMRRDNPWQKIYDPSRISLKAAPAFVSENVNAVGRMMKDWIKPEEIASVETLARGEGATLRKGATKIAAYRDETGEIHQRSAICTHLGCIVQWNSGEKSWDCPCHGSRFDPCGEVLHAPAVRPLGSGQ